MNKPFAEPLVILTYVSNCVEMSYHCIIISLNPSWFYSFPGLFGSTDYRTVKKHFKSGFFPLPVLI